MEEEVDIPKNDCKGCQKRDELLGRFAVYIDEQNRKIEELEKQLAEKEQPLDLAA